MNPNKMGAKLWYVTKVALAMLWAIPWVALGLLLALTIVGIPATFVCFAIGCAPYYFVEKRRVRQLVKWHYKSKTMAEQYEEDVPWEM